MTSWTKPTDQQVDEAVRLLMDGGHYAYFFDRLQNPLWIEPLAERGFFKEPPGLISDDEAGTVTLPNWPESAYLARMAPEAPTSVLKVIKSLPDTQNSRVIRDLVDALMRIPPDDVGSVLPKVLEWVDTPYKFGLVDKLGELTVHLTHASSPASALKLAKGVLSLSKGQSGENRSSYDEWEYGQFLKKYFPALVNVAPVAALGLANDILRNALNSKGGRRDYSYIWRPAIEEHEQNSGHSIEDHLVDLVVETARSIIRSDGSLVQAVLDALRRHRLPFFLRLELFILNEFGHLDPAAVELRLADRALFDDLVVRHEYAGLLAAQSRNLSENARGEIVKWITEGPDPAPWCAAVEDRQGTPPTDDQVRGYKSHWQRDRMAWFGESLPDEMVENYKALVREFGAPDHPDFVSYSRGVMWGPQSPKSDEEIQAMQPDELISYLRDWKPSPSDRTMSDSRVGLGRTVEAAVTADPARFAALGPAFRDLHPTYLGHFLSGLAKSNWAERSWDWDEILDTVDWVACQGGGKADEADDALEHTWRTTKLEAVRLVDAAVRNNGIDFKYRERVWSVLHALSSDPDPAVDEDDIWAKKEPWTQALNTVRGEVFQSIMQYALWCHRHIPKEAHPKGFGNLPEVRKILDEHLDVGCEPAPAIRSVYGQFFPWLQLIDRRWAEDNANAIFSPEPDHQVFWYAAWGAYILFDQPYDDVLDSLLAQYSLACERLDDSSEEVERRELGNRLAEHLMIFFWRGKLAGEAGKDLLAKFWSNAPVRARGHAVWFLGRTLKDTSIEVSPDLMEQFQALWDSRLGAEAEDKSEELSYFGSWLASGRFPPAWSLQKLRETLAQSRALKDREAVFEALPSVAASEPLLTIQALRDLIDTTKEPWSIDYKKEDIEQTLMLIAASRNQDAAGLAQECVDVLAARGFLVFRHTLESVQAPPA
jgi:hypothetical protein